MKFSPRHDWLIVDLIGRNVGCNDDDKCQMLPLNPMAHIAFVSFLSNFLSTFFPGRKSSIVSTHIFLLEHSPFVCDERIKHMRQILAASCYTICNGTHTHACQHKSLNSHYRRANEIVSCVVVDKICETWPRLVSALRECNIRFFLLVLNGATKRGEGGGACIATPIFANGYSRCHQNGSLPRWPPPPRVK